MALAVSSILKAVKAMAKEYVEQRNGGYFVVAMRFPGLGRLRIPEGRVSGRNRGVVSGLGPGTYFSAHWLSILRIGRPSTITCAKVSVSSKSSASERSKKSGTLLQASSLPNGGLELV
jgi:hypothetical protein